MALKLKFFVSSTNKTVSEQILEIIYTDKVISKVLNLI